MFQFESSVLAHTVSNPFDLYQDRRATFASLTINGAVVKSAAMRGANFRRVAATLPPRRQVIKASRARELRGGKARSTR